jgi:hypothetical protein
MSWTGRMLRRVGVVAAVLAVAMWLGTGCEDNGGNGGGGGGNKFVGSWEIDDTTDPAYNPWYVHFQADGTWYFSDFSDGTNPSGIFTYTISGGMLVGPFTNPGVGDGRIEATVQGNTISINFIEYWHTPYKVVPYTGIRL